MSRTITEKQTSFLLTLIEDREATGGPTADMIGTMSSFEASRAIDYLLRFPSKRKAQQPAQQQPAQQLAVEDGFYVLGETIYRVKTSKAGRPYALKADESGHFEYEPGGIARLSGARAMTLEDAKTFGHRFGSCCMCGRLLSDPESIEAGIGPVCANKYF